MHTHTTQTLLPVRLPPAPHVSGFPIIGVVPHLMRANPFYYLRDLMLKHGDFVSLQLGPQTLYLVSSPDFMQQILRDNHRNYRKPDALYKSARKLLSNGLVTSEGDCWLRQRRMIQPHLHRKQLKNLYDTMVSAVGGVLADWEAFAQHGRPVNLGNEMSRITMAVITQTMFGSSTLSESEMTEVATALSTVIDYSGRWAYFPFIPDWMPLPGKGEYQRAMKRIKQTIMKLIEHGRAHPDSVGSLLGMLLNTVDEQSNAQMDDQQLFDEAITIFTAGYETTATALTWLWTVLEQRPDIEAKLVEELDTVLQGRTPAFEDLRSLDYARKVFAETLRFYPIAPFLPRAALYADYFGEYEMPQKSQLLLFYFGLHHNPRYWEQPEVFDPQRFAREREAARHPFAYLPFSGGPRKCAGDEFAQIEGILVMAMLLQRYRMTLVPGGNYEPKLGSTLRPHDPVMGVVQQR
jgi:cytochrome P450